MSETARKRILLVEDEAILAMHEKMQLEKYGYDVMSVMTGEQAVEFVRTSSGVELVLMDIDLGNGIDGTQAAALILKEYDVPVVFLSSHTEPEIVAKTETISSYGYVVKNSSITVLDASIKMAFRLFEANRKLKNELIERQRMEAVVREQRYFAESLIETARTIILVLDMDGGIVRFNSYTEKLLGYRLDEVKGTNWVELFVQPEESTSVTTVLKEAMVENQTVGNVNSVITKDGQTILVEWYNEMLKDAEGNTIGILATGTDITERRRMEDVLNESMARYDDLVALIPVGVYIVWIRASGGVQFEYVSDRWCDIHGVRREDVLADARAVNDLVHPDDRDSFLESNREAAQVRKPFQWEGRFFTGDGTLLWLRIESMPVVLENGDIRWFGVTRDITERKQVESELTVQKAHLETVLKTSSDGFWVVTPDKRIVDVNPAYCRMSGYSAEELMNMRINDIDALENPEESAARVKRIMANGSEMFETKHRRKDGTLFDVEVSASRVDQGSGVFLVSFCRDITERKRSETAIQELLAEKETLITEIQHRIKNNITTMTSVLSLQTQTLEDPTAIAALENAKNRLASLAVLYNYLHATNARGNGSLREYLERLVTNEVEVFPHGRRVTVHSEIEEWMCASNTLSTIGLIVNELVTNAMKYAFPDHPNPRLNIDGVHSDGHYTLTIHDNGPGFPGLDQRQRRTSAGFGSMIVNALTEQLHGTIRFNNDHGTCITLEFPVTTDG